MEFQNPLSLVVTHPGGAHKDDFLACAVCLALHRVPVERRDPADTDLENPETAVIDVGGRNEASLNNFDHHQFSADHAPICSLSLVLMALGKYERAKQFCAWLEPAEWLDSRGAKDTAEYLGVAREVIGQLLSPIDVTLLRRFASKTRIEVDDPLHAVMRMVGEDLLAYIGGLEKKMEFLKDHARLWSWSGHGMPATVLFLPRTEPLPPEPSAGIGLYVEQEGLADEIAGLVYPDRRGEGYGLSRFNDDPRLDFTRIGDEVDVHFAHARGFVAKTSSVEEERLKQLMVKAWVG